MQAHAGISCKEPPEARRRGRKRLKGNDCRLREAAAGHESELTAVCTDIDYAAKIKLFHDALMLNSGRNIVMQKC